MATAETSGQRLERLKSLVPGLTNDVIGEWFGLTAQAVQKWTKAEVPRNRFATIVEKTGVAEEWLVLGKGEPFPVDDKEALPAATGAQMSLAEDTGVTVDHLLNGFGQANTEAGPEIRDNRVPVIGAAAAGAFRHIEQLRPDEIEEYVASMKNQDGYRFALRIIGQSMENPGGKKHIPDGSIVIFNARRTDPETGDLVLAKLLFGEETTFKKFVRDAGKVWLEPLNPRYPMITEQFQVIATAEEMVQIL
uniref:SOS-response transcriptional repressors (RecA-mediated autopeptidases) n=1 Tax=Myoviridae sp. ctRci5 TaxID=2825105 RepID=A0A8S5V6C6_9CAUD|nr:MAG TPA: SOS-response transcriptional repressors (RecA-mediated autopeptidases) [Myoviridae sp. ctRci5]